MRYLQRPTASYYKCRSSFLTRWGHGESIGWHAITCRSLISNDGNMEIDRTACYYMPLFFF